MEMENHPMKAIMDLSHLVRRATEQQMADLEISSVQSRVLGYLWWKAWKKEPAFQKELEAEFKIRRSSVCSVVQCLEKRGLLERRSVSTDARQKELVLTDEGMKIQSEVINRLEQMESKMNGWLTPEEQSWWIRCINKLETGLKEAEYD